MNVELLVVPDCPNAARAELLLRVALDDVGLSGVLPTKTVIDTQEAAAHRRFMGSPTILVDGADPFAEPDGKPGIACRLYANPTGPSGVPALSALRKALKQAATTRKELNDGGP